jgi:hypothetical protein
MRQIGARAEHDGQCLSPDPIGIRIGSVGFANQPDEPRRHVVLRQPIGGLLGGLDQQRA